MYSLFPNLTPSTASRPSTLCQISCHLPSYHYFLIFFLHLTLPCTHSSVSSSVLPDFHLLILKTPSSWQAVHSSRNLLRSSWSSISVRLAIDLITRNSFAVCSSVSIIYHLPRHTSSTTSPARNSLLFSSNLRHPHNTCSAV